jgi:hypothetical protein
MDETDASDGEGLRRGLRGEAGAQAASREALSPDGERGIQSCIEGSPERNITAERRTIAYTTGRMSCPPL